MGVLYTEDGAYFTHHPCWLEALDGREPNLSALGMRLAPLESLDVECAVVVGLEQLPGIHYVDLVLVVEP